MIGAMDTQAIIHQAVGRLAADPLPQRIILFGSQARGYADAGSDIDLLEIEAEVPNRAAKMVRLRRLLSPLPAAFTTLTQHRSCPTGGRKPCIR